VCRLNEVSPLDWISTIVTSTGVSTSDRFGEWISDSGFKPVLAVCFWITKIAFEPAECTLLALRPVSGKWPWQKKDNDAPPCRCGEHSKKSRGRSCQRERTFHGAMSALSNSKPCHMKSLVRRKAPVRRVLRCTCAHRIRELAIRVEGTVMVPSRRHLRCLRPLDALRIHRTTL